MPSEISASLNPVTDILVRIRAISLRLSSQQWGKSRSLTRAPRTGALGRSLTALTAYLAPLIATLLSWALRTLDLETPSSCDPRILPDTRLARGARPPDSSGCLHRRSSAVPDNSANAVSSPRVRLRSPSQGLSRWARLPRDHRAPKPRCWPSRSA